MEACTKFVKKSLGLEQFECSVCLNDQFGRKDKTKIVGCNHIFCVNCITKWCQIGKITCPLCRTTINSIKIYRKYRKPTQVYIDHSDDDSNSSESEYEYYEFQE